MNWWYANDKESVMEFDKSRCYSALNADELRAGDKVIVADNLLELKNRVEAQSWCGTIVEICGECTQRRFAVNNIGETGRRENTYYWELAYLVERKENCTNCGMKSECKDADIDNPELHNCLMWEKTTENKYRPFRDCDELIKVWCKKNGYAFDDYYKPLTMPFIWVKWKESPNDEAVITSYSGVKQGVFIIDTWFQMDELLYTFTFLDGSPCGVEEE